MIGPGCATTYLLQDSTGWFFVYFPKSKNEFFMENNVLLYFQNIY